MPPKHGHGHKAEHSSGTSYGGAPSSDDGGFDFSKISSLAGGHAGDSGDSSMFGTALSMIQGKSSQLSSEGVDESHLVNSHKSFFGSGGTGGEATTSGMGGAAAMEALKMFGSGSSSSSSSGGDMKQQLMGAAMGQAAKLFDQQNSSGNVASGASKEGVVQEAGEQALKMYMASEMGGSSGGSGLMGMASKVL